MIQDVLPRKGRKLHLVFYFPMGLFFFPSVSSSELLLLHPAQSLPKSPRQCSMLLLSVILLCIESFEEAWIDDFSILKSEIIERC